MDIGHDFARALAVIFQSIPVCICPDMCGGLHVSYKPCFWMLFLAAVHANTSFKALFDTLHLFSDMPLCGS